MYHITSIVILDNSWTCFVNRIKCYYWFWENCCINFICKIMFYFINNLIMNLIVFLLNVKIKVKPIVEFCLKIEWYLWILSMFFFKWLLIYEIRGKYKLILCKLNQLLTFLYLWYRLNSSDYNQNTIIKT